MTTEPFAPVTETGLAEVLADLIAAPEYAAWPEWAKAQRGVLLRMHHGQRPPPMAKGLYAMAKAGVDLGPAGWAALGQAAHLASLYALNDIGQNGVAGQLAAIARRERGEAGDWPAPETDPPVEPAWASFIPPDPEPEGEP